MEQKVSDCKVCILFRLDHGTERCINEIVRAVEHYHQELVDRTVKSSGLPYHMTMIGGASVTATESGRVIREVVSILKPFQDERWLPKIRDLEPAELNGNYLGIRLKFEPKSYVLTGNRKLNQEIVKRLAPKFHLDSVRHISCCRVLGGFAEMDTVKPTFIAALEVNKKELAGMTLTPEVWVKGEKKWSRFEF